MSYASPEQYRRVWDIHRILVPKPEDLISTNRFFVREGPVNMYSEKERKKKPYYLFLFNDVMLICKKLPKQKWRVKIYVTLRSTYVHTENIAAAGFDAQFRLHCRTRSFNFYCTSDDDREGWLRDINASISGDYENEHSDKDFQKKHQALSETVTPSAVPPSDLESAARKRSNSDDRGEKKARSATASPPTKTASRSGRTRAESSLPPGETNPRSKASPQKARSSKTGRATATNAAIGDPSQWDPYGATAMKKSSTSPSPTLIQSSPGLLAGASAAPAASPFDSFLVQSQPGFQTSISYAGTPRPASTLFSSAPNVFTTNPVQHRSTVNFGSTSPFFSSDGGNTSSAPQNYRATVNFGSPAAAASANPFMTNPVSPPMGFSSSAGVLSSASPTYVVNAGGATGGGGAAVSGANPFSPRASVSFGSANPFMTNGPTVGTATNNPFLSPAPTSGNPF